MYIKVSSKYIDPSISFGNEARAKMSSGVYIEVNEHANRARNKIAESKTTGIFKIKKMIGGGGDIE